MHKIFFLLYWRYQSTEHKIFNFFFIKLFNYINLAHQKLSSIRFLNLIVLQVCLIFIPFDPSFLFLNLIVLQVCLIFIPFDPSFLLCD
jgi:hypothetical protein